MPDAVPEVGTKGVAPAMVLPAPRAATAAADLSRAPIGEPTMTCSTATVTFMAGVRCSSTINRAPGARSQRERSRKKEQIFMATEVRCCRRTFPPTLQLYRPASPRKREAVTSLLRSVESEPQDNLSAQRMRILS